jgi:hypothetical protein
VQTDQINIPEWAFRHALEGFTREADVIWVKQRAVAKQITREDAGCGGKPQFEKVIARRCSICQMWCIGLLADDRKMVEERYTGKLQPCSSTCLGVARARKTLSPELLRVIMWE